LSGSGTGIVTPYTTHRGIDLDGAADSYTHAGDLAGNANSQLGTVSFWFRIAGGDGGFRVILDNTTSRFIVILNNTNTLQIRGRDVGNVIRLNLVTTPTYLAGSGWHHCMASWDLSVPVRHIYIDGAIPALGTDTTSAINNIDYTRNAWAYGAAQAGGSRWNGALQEGYFNFAEYVDLSVEANRFLFRHPNGQPPFIGATGQLPTTNQPILYLVEEAGVFANRGSDGTAGWVTVGAPAVSADSPKDRWNASLRHRRRKRRRHAA
jgi:hypothetical protein